MSSNFSFSILIWINITRTKNNMAELFARVTVNSKGTNISLKRKIDVDSWDKSKSRVKGSTMDAKISSIQ